MAKNPLTLLLLAASGFISTLWSHDMVKLDAANSPNWWPCHGNDDIAEKGSLFGMFKIG
jgi:hypothetical protein